MVADVLRWSSGVTPEEWVARHSHKLSGWPFDGYRFEPLELDHWVHTVGRLLRSPSDVDRARRAHLSLEERAQVAKYLEEDF
jgi:hypothetical protein